MPAKRDDQTDGNRSDRMGRGPAGTGHWWRVATCAVLLMTASGCLGPNPLFFVSTSAANAAIMTIVSALVGNLVQLP